MGVYLLWAIMTILSTRVYLNLVYLARKPVIEEHNSTSQGQQFEGRTNFGGIRMRVQTTTVGDAGEIVTFGSQESRPPVPLRTFDSASCSHVSFGMYLLTLCTELRNRKCRPP